MEKNPENNHLSKNKNCGLKTELSLGLPGSESPERKHNGVTIFGKDFEQNSQTFNTSFNNNNNNNNNNINIKGSKRGFCDAIDECENWVLGMDEGHFGHFTQHGKHAQHLGFDKESEENSGAHAAKAQVVGWPPIRSFRKNTMASTFAKNDENTQGKPVSECLYVKVSMDGAPYLRKVDLRNCTNYKELSLALEKMFSCFISGQCGSHGHGKRKEVEGLSIEYLRASEYVLTYEDKDGDWMLVGDVPWKMFMENCRKLRIMKGSEAIGLAPNADEECKVQASE